MSTILEGLPENGATGPDTNRHVERREARVPLAGDAGRVTRARVPVTSVFTPVCVSAYGTHRRVLAAPGRLSALRHPSSGWK